jgi:3-dehydroquinate dehydratase-2
MTSVYVLNGPNLNRLGTREPDIYGHTTFVELAADCEQVARSLGLEATVLQTTTRPSSSAGCTGPRTKARPWS